MRHVVLLRPRVGARCFAGAVYRSRAGGSYDMHAASNPYSHLSGGAYHRCSLSHQHSRSSSTDHSTTTWTIEERVVASLDTLGATYTLEQCDEALSDTREWCEAYGHTIGSSTSCIILASKMEPKQYGCCLVMGDRRVDVNKKARSLMGLSKKKSSELRYRR